MKLTENTKDNIWTFIIVTAILGFFLFMAIVAV